jgi:hypothetical protein
METIATYQQLSVFIEGILDKYFSGKDLREFTGNHEQLHRCFYELKQQHPKYFQRLTFDVNSNYPYSKDLDSILQDFQICGIINKLNPTFKTIIFNGDDDLSARKEKRIPFVNEDELIAFATELTI